MTRTSMVSLATLLVLTSAARAANEAPSTRADGTYRGYPAAPPPPPLPATTPGQATYPAYGNGYGYPQPPAGDGSWPVAVLRSNSQRARLQVMSDLKWRDVCIAPCVAYVNPQAEYRIGGSIIQPSDTFRMPRPNGQIIIDARATTVIKHWTGFGLMAAGALAATGGVVLYAATPGDKTGGTYSQMEHDQERGVGIFLGLIGVVLMAVGIPMFVRGTSVELE